MNSQMRKGGIAGVCGVCVLLVACGAPAWEWGAEGQSPQAMSVGTMSSMTLDDYLATQSGVRVDGRGPSARIHLSGATPGSPPLFVIDGMVIGYDFSRIWNMVRMPDVSSINVIRASHTDAVIYGARGGNGVIEITMKRGGSTASADENGS